MNPIIKFYTNNQVLDADLKSLTFEDIFWWNDDYLESRHSYIQWYFPLLEPSTQVPGSPVLDEESVFLINRYPEVYGKMQRKAFVRMLAFFELRYSLLFKTIRCKNDWLTQKPKWVNVGEYNHNYRRITRIMKSLTLFGNDVLAQRLYRCLVLANNDFYNNTGVNCFSDEVLKFWSNATSNTLNTINHEKP